MKRLYIIINILFCAIIANAQDRFVYLTTDDVRIDSLLPTIGYRMDLPDNYEDSIYTVTLVYPEYIDMSADDIKQYNHLSGAALPEIPQPEYSVAFDRKKPVLNVCVQPLAFRDNQYKWLSSFMLKIESAPVATSKARRASSTGSYAENSVLANGKWAKIRVSETGIYELTEAVAKQAGFTDISKVKIYGYGGNLQPEKISRSYLYSTDDLQEVPQCIVGSRHLFFAKGPVSWDTSSTTLRTRNPYSNYGYYFLTENDDETSTISEDDLKEEASTSNDAYHSLYENDAYAWYHGGRNLYDGTSIAAGASKTYTFENNTTSTSATFAVYVSANTSTPVSVSVNDSVVGTINVTLGSYQKANVKSKSYTINGIKSSNTVKLTVTSGGPARLDYISVTYPNPAEVTDLTQSFPAPEYVYNITNQNHHADAEADMVIIVPTSQKLTEQAQRLADFHKEHDGMRVNVVPADELYNEFSSGTPDANAYRRYMKLLYDRATSETDMPKYLVLFGDCVWDNRMLTSGTQTLSPDDYLLCFESENSVSETDCYVDDMWFCRLDEGEGVNPQSSDLADVASGRIPVTTASDAKVVVDKSISYMKNENAGAWENTLVFLGDDGNNNLHMAASNEVADTINARHPNLFIKKVMWDTYDRVTSSNGNTYPEVTKLIKQQVASGALIFNYAGHGSGSQLSHETVLTRADFASFTNTNLPLWITASCDIMAFDANDENLGETALLNKKGGAIAFFGTTRTVYANYNKNIDHAFLRYALSQDENGKYYSIGEAQRLAKNYLITAKSGSDRTTNKLHYAILGDPAIRLNIPEGNIVVDSINGQPVNASDMPTLKAGSVARISGYIQNQPTFLGSVSATVRDSKETIACRRNDTADTDTAFVFVDRTKTLFTGTTNAKDGRFNLEFSVPMDINYSNGSGLVNLVAVSDDKTITANGHCEDFNVGGTESISNDSIGPSIYCYLNSPAFVNGGDVNPTPYFVAKVNDEDGINVTGTGIGHDLMLIIDGDMSKTYNLNDNFTYDFGSYTSGSTFYSLPTLSTGEHTLKFRAWDIFNNSSTTELKFNVAESLEPEISSISCTNNPASQSTTFIVNHNRMGSDIDVIIEVMDMSGRLLWKYVDNGVNGSGSYTVDWDLTQTNGQALQTGVYLYRARVACDGSDFDSKAKKLIVIR